MSSVRKVSFGDGIPKGRVESLDYDESEKDRLRAVAELPLPIAKAIARRKAWLTVVLLLTIGLSTGSLAYLMTWVIDHVNEIKWGWVDEGVAEGKLEGWLRLMSFCVPLSLLAALLTHKCPDAGGSGIPYVKSFLNGNGLKLGSFTLVAKVIGICCVVICGVPGGIQGPMVHSGAILAAVLTRVWAHLVQLHLRVPTYVNEGAPSRPPPSRRGAIVKARGKAVPRARAMSFLSPRHSHRLSTCRRIASVQKSPHEQLRAAAWTAGGFDNDRDRRNFVSMGAAAGVAAAFNAPIGGVLFSLEEVSSFWDPHLTWMTFVTAAVAAFSVNYWGSGIQGTFADSGLVIFAEGSDATTYELWEIVPFTLIGVLCGVLGALFNAMNKQITLRRKLLLGARPKMRVLEAIFTVCLVVSVHYLTVQAYGCTEPPIGAVDDVRSFSAHGVHPVRHTCPRAVSDSGSGSGSGSGSDAGGSAGVMSGMNEMATLLLQPMESAVVQLFSRGTPGYFSLSTLVVFVPLYFVSAVFTYGIAVPSGLFIPCMMMGAGIGRFCGELLHQFNSEVDPGVYALVGAAGMLGGIIRMTISLTVILVEVSNDIRLLLPIVMTLVMAKMVGDRFTLSLYDVHILLSGATLLVPEPTPASTSSVLTARSLLEQKNARKKRLRTVRVTETLRNLTDLLRKTRHHAFPVIFEETGGLFAGLIGRGKLEALVRQAQADGAMRGQKIDLRLHYDHAPYTVHELLPLYRVSRLFMTMGLRHLCVLDGISRVVGIITRADLACMPKSYGDVEKHLDASQHGAATMKRMLDAQHQASFAMSSKSRRRMSDPNPLKRTASEPNVCCETPSRMQPGASFYAPDESAGVSTEQVPPVAPLAQQLMARAQQMSLSPKQRRLMKRRSSV